MKSYLSTDHIREMAKVNPLLPQWKQIVQCYFCKKLVTSGEWRYMLPDGTFFHPVFCGARPERIFAVLSGAWYMNVEIVSLSLDVPY